MEASEGRGEKERGEQVLAKVGGRGEGEDTCRGGRVGRTGQWRETKDGFINRRGRVW